MSQINDDLKSKITEIFKKPYLKDDVETIPSLTDIPLRANYGLRVDLATLFVDLRNSTMMVKALTIADAARMYKSFLVGVSTIAKENNGKIMSFNGDGVLVGFDNIGKEQSAVIAALQISHFLQEVLRPKITASFDTSVHTDFSFGIGVTTGVVLVIKGGIQGLDNHDFVWVGDSVNTAVKLSGYSKNQTPTENYVFISGEVFIQLPENMKKKKTMSAVHTALPLLEKSFWVKNLPPMPLMGLLFGGNDVYTTKCYIEFGAQEIIEVQLSPKMAEAYRLFGLNT